MRVLVTGASGFLGRHLMRALAGHDVITLARGEDPSIVRTSRPAKIFHLAGERKDESAMFDSNARLTYDLLEASRTVDYQVFCYIGSSSEYGRCNVPMNEQQPIRPTTLYEATKGCGTLLCMSMAATGRPVCVVRPFSVYGPFQDATSFIPSLYRSYRNGTTLDLAPGYHDWIYVDDFIRGLLAVGDAPSDVICGQIVNLGTGIQTSNSDVVNVFREVIGDVRVRPVPRMRPYDSDCWVADTARAKQLFGFEAKVTLAEGLRAYAAEQT